MDTLLNYKTNIYTRPENIKKIFITPKNVAFVRELKRNALTTCRGEISESYIKRTCKTFTHGFVYVRENKILGFILWKIDTAEPDAQINTDMMPSKQVFIQLICSEKTGTDFGYVMLSDVESYCVNNTIPFMCLEPGNGKLEMYYRNFGFMTLSRYPLKTIMCKPVLELLHVSQDRSKTRRRGRGALSTHDMKLITLLHKNGPRLEEELAQTIASNEYLNGFFNRSSQPAV
jgi:hypothetical protein